MVSKVPYVDYYGLDEFYTINQVCKLFQMEKAELKSSCKRYRVEPRQNEIGEFGFVKYDVRKLHNFLYHEDTSHEKEADPWA